MLVIIYSPSCHSKTLWLSFLWGTQKKIFWRTLEQTLEPTDFHFMDTKHWDIPQNIFFYVPQREERIQFSFLVEVTWYILDLNWVSDNVVSWIRYEQELVYHSNVWNAPWSVYYHIKKLHLNCWTLPLSFSSLLFSSLSSLFSSLFLSSLLFLFSSLLSLLFSLLFSSLLLFSLFSLLPFSLLYPTHSPLLSILFLHSTLPFSSPQIRGESQSISESLALSFVRCGVERARNCPPHLNCTVGQLLRL